jgi:hypothetical protein
MIRKHFPYWLVPCLIAFASRGESAVWKRIEASLPESIRGICVRRDTLWAAMENGVRRTADGGTTWSDPGIGLGQGTVAGIASAGGMLAACRSRTLFLSADGGSTWFPRDSLPYGTFVRMDVWNDTLYAWHSLYGYPHSPEAAWVSGDSGLTWRDVPLSFPPLPEPRRFQADTFVFSGRALIRANSDGPVEVGTLPAAILEVAPASDRMFVLTEAGLFVAPLPQGPWAPVRKLAPAQGFRALAADSDAIAFAASQGLFLSRNRGADWESVPYDVKDSPHLQLTLSSAYLYASNSEWGPDGASRFVFATSVWEPLVLPGSGVYLALGASGDRLALAVHEHSNAIRFMISVGTGSGFRSTGILSGYLNGKVKLALDRDRLAVSNDFRSWVSRDDGATWSMVASAGSCLPATVPASLALTDSGVYLADAGGGLWRAKGDSSDCGWIPVPLPDGTFRKPSGSLQIAGTGGRLYLATSDGLWVLTEGGEVSLTGHASPARHPSAARRFPVRVWRRPSTLSSRGVEAGMPDGVFDARGVKRRIPAR